MATSQFYHDSYFRRFRSAYELRLRCTTQRVCSRDVEAVIFQSLPLPPLPLSKNEKTTVDLSKFVIYYSQKV